MLTQEQKTRMFMSEVVDKLQIINKLEKENEDLKKELESLKRMFNSEELEGIKLKKENEDLKKKLEISTSVLEKINSILKSKIFIREGGK